MTDRYNQPDEGATDWHVPLNENFLDLGIEVADQVATWADLPAPTGRTSSNGNPKVYRVAEDRLFVADGGDGWRIIGGLGSAEHPLPETHHESVVTERVSETLRFVGPDDSLQGALDDASAAGGGVVHLSPGVHDGHDYPVDLPNDVALVGPSSPRGPVTGDATAFLDAGGGDALVAAGSGFCAGIYLARLTVHGTVRFASTKANRNIHVEHVSIVGADSDVGSGRGLEIVNSGYLYRLDNVAVADCDGYGIHVRSTGQCYIAGCSTHNCGGAVDGACQFYSSVDDAGGAGVIVKPICSGAGLADGSEVDGIVCDGLYTTDVVSPQVEQMPRDGLVFTGTLGKTVNPTVTGGGHVWGSGRDNVAVGRDASGGRTYGFQIDGTTLRKAGGVDLHLYPDCWRSYVSSAYGGTSGGRSFGNVSVRNDGWRNQANQQFAVAYGGGSADLTGVSPTFDWEWRFHDGSGSTLPRGPAIYDPEAGHKRWRSLIDGSTVNPP